MTDSFWADVLIGVLAALLLAWLVLVIVLATLRPRGDCWRWATPGASASIPARPTTLVGEGVFA